MPVCATPEAGDQDRCIEKDGFGRLFHELIPLLVVHGSKFPAAQSEGKPLGLWRLHPGMSIHFKSPRSLFNRLATPEALVFRDAPAGTPFDYVLRLAALAQDSAQGVVSFLV
ncbi:MAG: hypothetical protein HW389_3424 [Bacteroidetes bacterium]|nr:hypothetical protein [Bacteroidota bacterium]